MCGDHIEIHGYRLIVDDHVFLGQRDVVHHRHTRQRHINGLAYFAISAHHDVLNMIHPLRPRIDHGMHLTRHRINFGVCGKRPRKRAFKIVSAHGFQLIGQFNRGTPSFNHCPSFTSKRAYVGIRATR